MVSALFEIFIGFTGLIGFLLRFIGPISIAPTITLIGVALFNVAADQAGKKNQNEWRAKIFNVFFNLEISTREHINAWQRQKHYIRPSSKILREKTVFGRFYFQFVQMLAVLKFREDDHSEITNLIQFRNSGKTEFFQAFFSQLHKLRL